MGKYHVITTPHGYAVRCILTGYIEAKCKSFKHAQRICNLMNGGKS
jgi:hypothetical protein